MNLATHVKCVFAHLVRLTPLKKDGKKSRHTKLEKYHH